MEDIIFNFVSKQSKLLLLEREKNLQNFFNDHSPANLQKLESNSQALTKLNIVNLTSKGADRTQIDLVCTGGLPLEHGLSSGDLVTCIRTRDRSQTVKAIVIELGESSLSVSINSNDIYKDIQEDEIFTIVKTDSDFTYKNQARAVNCLNEKKIQLSACYPIVKVLFDTNKEVVNEMLLSENKFSNEQLDNQGKLKFYNSNLAVDQKSAVEFALKRKHFCIIQGPPGTGKTTTLIEIIVQLSRLGKKVLVCAPTNVAVDNLVIHLGKIKAKPLRLGHPSRIAKEALRYSLDAHLEQDDSFVILKDIKKSIKDAELNIENSKIKFMSREIRELKNEYRKRLTKLTCEILRRCLVILCTLNSASPNEGQLQNLPRDFFDVLVVDEASQAMEASMWIAIPHAPKLILAGDINQLPPVIMCHEAATGGLNVSLMERAIEKLKTDCYITLTKQYRMNEKIMTWSSKKFYNGSLVADDSVKAHLIKDLPSIKLDDSLENEAVVYIDTCGCECEEFNAGVEATSKGNFGEAVIVDKVLTKLIEAGLSHKNIGVITPYALQADLIRRSFASKSLNVEISTVDAFQGREKEVIVLSLVRSNQDKELGFVTDFRRLNVAVTRARRLLIVIADSETMEKNELITSLLKYIELNGLIQTAEEYLAENINNEIVKIENISQKHNQHKLRSKAKAKVIKREKFEKGLVSPEVEKKAYEEILQKRKLKITEKKAINANTHIKSYNLFEKIATTQLDEKESYDFEETPKLIDQVIISEDKNTSKKNFEEYKTVKKSDQSKSSNDFDKVIQEFMLSNSVCSFENCKKSTKLIKLVCEFCKKWFCLEHGLQEIHGCGAAVRRKEQKAFRHKKPDSVTKKEKDKFARKLKELEEARKPKKK